MASPGTVNRLCETSTPINTGEFEPPVYALGHTCPDDLVFDQHSLDKTWAAVQNHLRTQLLSESEMLEVLKSGLLQTDTGRSMADLFVEAMMRSIQPKGDLTVEGLRAWVEVICYLPPSRWEDALGQCLFFSGNANTDSVIGFIQLQRNSSRYQRDEMIAQGELLTDEQWQSFCTTIKNLRSSVRPCPEDPVNSALAQLEEFLEVRPSTKEAASRLGELLGYLDETKTTREEPFPDQHKHAVRKLWQGIKPEPAPSLLTEFVNRTNSALNALGVITAKEMGEVVFDSVKSAGNAAVTALSTTVAITVSMANIVYRATTQQKSVFASDATSSELADAKQSAGFSLVSALEEIDRKAEFYSRVDIHGMPVPQGRWAKVLYVLNAVDTGKKLWGSGIEIPPRAPVQTPHHTSPAMPNESAHSSSRSPHMKVTVANATFASNPFITTFSTGFEGPALRPHAQENVSHLNVGAFEKVEQFARQIDQLLTQSMHMFTGWHPVEAVEEQHPLMPLRNLAERLGDLLDGVRRHEQESLTNPDSPYALTVEPLEQEQPFIETLYADLGAWLQTAANCLAAMGVATLSAVTSVVQQHPRAAATVAMATIYAVVNEFFNLRAGAAIGGPHFVQEEDSGLRGELLNEVANLLKAMPSVDEAVRARISNSTFESPHEDSQLVNDVAGLLEQPVPWNRKITSGELIVKVAENTRIDYFHQHDLAPGTVDEGTTEPPRLKRSIRAAELVLEMLTDSGALSTADKQLQSDVLTELESSRGIPVAVPTGTLLHSSVELYKQALADPALLEFFTAKGLSLPTLRIYHNRVVGDVTENGQTSPRSFDLWDGSGWWPAAKALLPVLKLLDPDDLGLCHVGADSTAVPHEVVLRFYGVPPHGASAQQLASQLKTSGWPEFSSAKKARLEKAVEGVAQAAEEIRERAKLITALELSVKDKADNAAVTLSNTIMDFVSAPLAQASREIRHHLNDLLALPAMIELCEARKIDCSAFPVRVNERKIQVFFGNQWVDLTDDVNAQPALRAAFDTLSEQAKKSGCALYTSTSSDLMQLIRFRGFDAPKNAGDVRNIIRWLNTVIPPAMPLGNYGADLLRGTPASVTLSSDEKTQIIDLLEVLLGESPSVIQALGGHLLDGTSVEYRRTNAQYLLMAILDTGEAESWGEQFIETLNWYGGTEGQTASVAHYQQLLCAAIKLSVDPDVPGRLGNIAGYDVYQPKNRGRDLGEIRGDIEDHLIKTKGVCALTAPLVAHLFLADAAPEFLVHGGSDKVRMGTFNWMTLRLGAVLAEATDSGCSRAMTAEQLKALALLDPVTEENRLLFQSLGVDIMVAWGVMNGVVQKKLNSDYSPADYERAANLFARQRADIAKTLSIFSRPLQTRKELAIIELRKAFPKASLRQILATKLWSIHLGADWNIEAGKGTTHDLVEVYMADDLNTEDWYIPGQSVQTKKIWKRKIEAIPNLNRLLTASVDSYFSDFSEGFIAPTKLMFCELPLEDRQALQLGTVELFTLREETGQIKEDETPELQADFRGGYGTLMRCEHLGNVSYLEVFPSQMKIIKRSDLPDHLPLNGEMVVEKVKMSRGSPVNAKVQRGTELPFDFEAYTTGSVARANVKSRKLIIEKLGGSFAAESLVGTADARTYVPDIYFSSKLDRITRAIINDNFLQGQKAVLLNSAKGVTPRDKQKQFWENLKGFALQLLPFVGCVNDLNTGTRRGFIDGVFGCFADALSMLFGLVGGAVKGVGVVNSLSPFKVKAFELMKTGMVTTHSVINPLSGLPDLISGTARGTWRFGQMLTSGVFDITQSGLGRLQAGLDKARCFFGGAVGDVGKKLPGWLNADSALFKGVHRGANTTAIFQSNKWYGVDSSGNPFGPPLTDFTPLNP